MSDQQNRYLLTGGGTGGHVYPAIAMADELKRREPNAQFLYVGVRGKAEEKIVPARGYPLEFVTSQGWPGAKPNLAFFRFAISLAWGVFKAIRILRNFQPTVILATGGYVAAPVMLAWVILKRLKMTKARAFVHEQNLVPGRLNRLVGQLADRVGVSFEESRRFFPNAQWVGYPARKEICQQKRETSREKLNLPKDARVLLVFGGSQGSRSINRATVDALPALLSDPSLLVIHGVGRYRGPGYDPVADTKRRMESLGLSADQISRYQIHEYLDPIEQYYAASDLVICRAGAGSLTEVALSGLPALIIPKANLPGDHQVRNARALSARGAGRVIYELTRQEAEGLIETVDGKALAELVKNIMQDEEGRKTMGQAMREVADADALERIVDCVQQIAIGQLPPLTPMPKNQDEKLELSELTGTGLVNYLTRHGVDGLEAEEREYLAYRAEGYLAQEDWQTRNIGVKLLGLLKLADRLDLLLFIMRDKTPVPTWQKLVGGDLKQVGFIRRNAILSLRQINTWTPEVRQALLDSLQDPYFEVRSWAAQACVHFAEHTAKDDEFLKRLDALCDESNFEVTREGIRSLAQIDTRIKTYDRMREFFTHPNWRVREAVVFCLQRFVEREILSPERVQQDIEQLLVTSSGFVPHFQLREQIRALSVALKNARETECSTPSANG